MRNADELFMRRCLDLAFQGIGNVAPNPLVGCVIVLEGRIIGEGFHQQFGEPHAEVNAINSVKEEDQHLLPSSVLYVNLEPCSHHGKTPPCADLIIKNKIGHVVIGTMDPNPLVSGNGIEKIRQAFESDTSHEKHRLETGILKAECTYLNRRFFTWIEKKRPYIILKWAQTTDGFIARTKNERVSISNEYSRTLVHKWRSEEASIMVGTNTAQLDDPMLNARYWNNRHPVRIVLDRTLRLPRSLHLFDHSIPTLVFTEKQKSHEKNLEFITIDFKERLIENILHSLYEKGIQSILVEGGTELLQAFIDSSYWDEARIFTARVFFKEGISAPKLSGKETARDPIGSDQLIILRNET